MSKHKLSMILVIAITFLMGLGMGRYLGSCAYAMELPLEVALDDLNEDLDYTKVSIHAWVRSVKISRTRRLDEYFTTLKVASPSGRVLTIVSNEILRMMDRNGGQCVIIQGVYRTGGRFGGFLQDADFLIAKFVIRDFESIKDGGECGIRK